jgi:class 3 adenylate cyclase
LGILSPVDGRLPVHAARAVVVVQALERAGLALEGIGEAIRREEMTLDFVNQSSYERFAGLGSETFEAVSARTGVPIDLLMVVREAMGSAQPAPTDRLRHDERQVVPYLEFQLAHGFRPVVIERWLRVYGDSLRRIAETEADWFRSEILAPLFRAGKGAAEVNETIGRMDRELNDLGDQAVLALFHGQQSVAWLKNIMESFEAVLSRAGLREPLDHPPAICFLDLTGYTRLTDERGDEAAADLAGQLSRLVQRTSVQHGGKPVKWLGDGVMFYFREPMGGVRAALEMVDGAAKAHLPPAHVGLHAGPVLFQEGDYFGRTVNVAARIADYARQGEVLVSQEVVDASKGSGITFTQIGPVELKGVSEVLQLHIANRGA